MSDVRERSAHVHVAPPPVAPRSALTRARAIRPPQAQPESPVIKAFQGFWRTTTNLSVQVATGLGDVTASAISELQNIGQKNDQYSSPKVDVDAEWSKPFVSSSPVKKPKELRFSTEDEPSEFSEFNYWCAGALAASTRAHPRAAPLPCVL